jgi:hypothetical protein
MKAARLSARFSGALPLAVLALSLGACDNPEAIRGLIDHIRDHGHGEPPVQVGEGDSCGGFTRPARICKPDLFCMPKPGACNAPDAPGVCEATPSACSREFVPVCGCDGNTYNNDCLRRSARIGLLHEGPCDRPPSATLPAPSRRS